MTGSIGGIIEAVNYQGLEWKIGVHEQVVKSGRYKDMLSPERELTPEERVLIDQLVQDTVNSFVTDVATGRHLPEAQVRQIWDFWMPSDI